MENLQFLFPELKKIYQKFRNEQTIENANSIGQALAYSLQTIENKKHYLAHLFDLITSDDVVIIINAWSVPIMLEDSIAISRKVEAFRLLLDDKDLPITVLNEILKFIWLTRKAPYDLLSFLEKDLQNTTKIDEEIKKLLRLSNSDYSANLPAN